MGWKMNWIIYEKNGAQRRCSKTINSYVIWRDFDHPVLKQHILYNICIICIIYICIYCKIDVYIHYTYIYIYIIQYIVYDIS